jgi:hypothetical protein
MLKNLMENLVGQIDDLKLDENSKIPELKIKSDKPMTSRDPISSIRTSLNFNTLSSPATRPPVPSSYIPNKPSYEDAKVVREQIQIIQNNSQVRGLSVDMSTYFIKENFLKKETYINSLFNHNAELKDQSWFHGILPRKEVDELLENKGDFLVRV